MLGPESPWGFQSMQYTFSWWFGPLATPRRPMSLSAAAMMPATWEPWSEGVLAS